MLDACGRRSSEGWTAGAVEAGEERRESAGEAAGGDGVIASGSRYIRAYSSEDAEVGTKVTVTVEGARRTIVTNALPDHETGDFPNNGNPNAISAQDLTYEYTSEPTFVGETSSPLVIGVAVNGVKFEPGTAESVHCSSG